MNDYIKLIGTERLGDECFGKKAIDKLTFISHLPNVIKPCIALPDLKYKEKMEAPSSIAVAVDNHIIPHLSSTSLNCGMGLISTDLIENNDVTEKIGLLFDNIRKNKNTAEFEITIDELYNTIKFGPKSFQDKFDLDDCIIDSFEFSGNLFKTNNSPEISDIERMLPSYILNHKQYSGRRDLGIGLGGNHFLEIQKVEKIFNHEEAKKININSQGQIMIMYHGGGGIVPGLLGAYFSRRKKGYSDDLKTNIKRYWYHLKRSGPENLFSIFDYYLSRKQFISFPVESHEGKRLSFANICSMNYGYSYRLFFYLRARKALMDIFGVPKSSIKLVRDISHNSILHETINNKDMWIHRHNSCRITKNSIALLPGYFNTGSYVCMGMDNTEKTYNTAPHGAGEVISLYSKNGKLNTLKDKSTCVYRGNDIHPKIINHYTDNAIDDVVHILDHEKIMRPVVKLTPISVLKDFT